MRFTIVKPFVWSSTRELFIGAYDEVVAGTSLALVRLTVRWECVSGIGVLTGSRVVTPKLLLAAKAVVAAATSETGRKTVKATMDADVEEFGMDAGDAADAETDVPDPCDVDEIREFSDLGDSDAEPEREEAGNANAEGVSEGVTEGPEAGSAGTEDSVVEAVYACAAKLVTGTWRSAVHASCESMEGIGTTSVNAFQRNCSVVEVDARDESEERCKYVLVSWIWSPDGVIHMVVLIES